MRSETIGGYYSPALYTIVKGLIDALLLRIMPAVLFCLPFYYLMGLNRSPGHVAVFIGVVSLFSTAVGWLSLFICTFSSTPGLANLTIIVVLLVSMLFGGLVANLETMPKVLALRATIMRTARHCAVPGECVANSSRDCRCRVSALMTALPPAVRAPGGNAWVRY